MASGSGSATLDWTVKVRNAKRDPQITLCIDGPGRRTNYVQVFGTAEVVEGDVRERTLDLIRKYETDEADAQAHWEGIKEDRGTRSWIPRSASSGATTSDVRLTPGQAGTAGASPIAARAALEASIAASMSARSMP